MEVSMTSADTRRTFDLEERTFRFAQRVRLLIKQIPRTIGNIEDSKQVLRSSGSVGANYIEANEALSTKDFLMRIKISRKEAKESHYWLRLIDLEATPHLEPERAALIQEAEELTRIFGAIYRKSSC
jgi:four helix bundle protein